MIPITEVGKTNGGAALAQTSSYLRHMCWLWMEMLPSWAKESSGPQTAGLRETHVRASLFGVLITSSGGDYKEAVPGKRCSVLGSVFACNAVISRLCGLCRLASAL